MIFTQILVSYYIVLRIGAVQAEWVYNSVQWMFVWEKIKMSISSAYIECATGKRYHSIELANSFLLKYRYWALQKSQLAFYQRSFEHLASLPYESTQMGFHFDED